MITILIVSGVYAQNADSKWALGLGWNALQYKGDIGDQYNKLADWTNGYQIFVSRYLNPSFDAQLKFSYNLIKESGPDDDLEPADFLGKYVNFGLDFHYKLNNGYILPEDFFLQPYLTAGLGLLTGNSEGHPWNGTLNPPTSEENVTAFHPYFGFGSKIRLSPGFALFAEVAQMPTTNDLFDLTEDGGNDMFRKMMVGAYITLGSEKDTDRDGVPDKKDKCPGTPIGVAVDENGCPLDRDKDGVPDYKDDCPDTPGLPQFNGCPDRDGDGIPDKDDKCPDVPGLKKFNGCPDSDGDGVPDADDACGDTPKGCPVDAKGCPLDSDGDGLIDCQDNCPTEAGPKENKGCPERCGPIDMGPVYFDFDKAVLRPEGIAELDKLVAKLKECKDYNLDIAGHTCSIGTERYNKGLSERRSQAVVKYLLSKGINNAYIVSEGYGETKPAVPNTSTANREKNRRAEFVIKVQR